MKKIKYSPDAAYKLKEIKESISKIYGKDSAKRIVKCITDTVRDLSGKENIGVRVSQLFDVDTDYRYIYVQKNYVFYRIEKENIYIVNIYNERVDFMWKLFGVDTTPQETIDYWKEV